MLIYMNYLFTDAIQHYMQILPEVINFFQKQKASELYSDKPNMIHLLVPYKNMISIFPLSLEVS